MAAVCAMVIGIFYIVTHPALVGTAGRERLRPIYSVQREDALLSLTFNLEGPEVGNTAQLVQTLDALGIRATFFATGEWVRQNPGIAAALSERGHELMNLSDDHSPLNRRRTAAIHENIAACSEAILAATGRMPHLFRAPFGEYDDNIIAQAATLGMRTIQWSIDSGDRRGIPAQEIARQVVAGASPGGIVLLHGNLEETVYALETMVHNLQDAGFILLPVSELIHTRAYIISSAGRQIPLD